MSVAVTPEQAVSEFIRVRTYARYLEEEKRRETWEESVNRYVNWILKDTRLNGETKGVLSSAIINHEVMPSMRALWSAGKAADKDNTAIYNCSFLTIDSIESFNELLYILMCGTGVGFSVEAKYINQLPRIQITHTFTGHPMTIRVADSKEGWANALKDVLIAEFNGIAYDVDYSQIRPAGQLLKTFGGRSSGPEPLKSLFSFIQALFDYKRKRISYKLTPLECHDICCKIAEIVVVGGVRRSSMISLSDFWDEELQTAKPNNYFEFAPHRAMANNSAMYYEKPSWAEFNKEWQILAESGTGERGIFNAGAAKTRVLDSRRGKLEFFIDPNAPLATNPCSEILLRDKQFCNLSEVVLRSDDTSQSFLTKVRIATTIGVLQATKTYFPYLRPQWQRNCEEEQLLGVSITGQYDNLNLLTPELLEKGRETAKEIAAYWSQQLGTNYSAAITCVKPSGTVSQLTNAASGAHPRYANNYIRRYRISAIDPLYHLMRDCGVKFTPENGQSEGNATTYVCSFPVAAPNGAVTRHQVRALDQLKHYLMLQKHWTEHNTSMTIYVRPDEWDKLGKEVHKNFDDIIGVSFLGEENVYEQAPYEDITREEYNKLAAELPEINYSYLPFYEETDQTTGEFSYACTGSSCEL